jgi:hypothetical protein
MLKNILNFEGVSLLSKGEQKNVNGGLAAPTQTCRFTVTMNGQTRTTFIQGFADGQAGSSQANSSCVSVLANTAATRCSYDCAFDGMGN